MWLQKDERKILRYLYSKLGSRGLGSPQRLPLDEFRRVCSDEHAAETAARVLNERNLVTLRETDGPKNHIDIGLQVEGYDLGRKYNRFFTRSGLRFREYKDHWIWLIVSFVGGVLGSLIVKVLSDCL